MPNTLHQQLTAHPTDPNLHVALANHAAEFGNYFLANAEIRTAQSLGLDKSESEEMRRTIEALAPNLTDLNHNQFYRLKTLADAVNRQRSDAPLRILDVGGGRGELAAFLPDDHYCLVEPTINGMRGEDLPFEELSFDVVIACHVLEHVRSDQREDFLDQLMSRANHALILLNPFHVEGTSEKERLELIIQITNAEWAKEHLACELPRVEAVLDFAKKRSLNCQLSANGSMTTALALVFAEYFAAAARKSEEVKMMNRFWNTRLLGLMDSDDFPIGYLAVLTRNASLQSA